MRKIDVSKLRYIIANLDHIPTVQVGIIGSSKTKKRDIPTNATIGMTHEFGSKSGHIPERSFLRMPITEHFNDEVENNPIIKQDFEKIVEANGLLKMLKRLGMVAEDVIQRAFETSGWGKWPMTYREFKYAMMHPDKGEDEPHPKPLIDTGELRKAIASEVIK